MRLVLLLLALLAAPLAHAQVRAGIGVSLATNDFDFQFGRESLNSLALLIPVTVGPIRFEPELAYHSGGSDYAESQRSIRASLGVMGTLDRGESTVFYFGARIGATYNRQSDLDVTNENGVPINDSEFTETRLFAAPVAGADFRPGLDDHSATDAVIAFAVWVGRQIRRGDVHQVLLVSA